MKKWLILLIVLMTCANFDFFLIKHFYRPPLSLPPITSPAPPTPPIVRPREYIPQFISVPTYRTSEKDTVYGDIISHSRGSPFGNASGRMTNAHETTHGINSEIRNANFQQGKSINGFYVLNGRGVVLQEPHLTMIKVKKFVPQSLQSYRWKLYFDSQLKSWNDMPTYICDEWVAYVNGGACAVDDVLKGNFHESWSDGVSGCCDFSFYVMALAMATKQHDPEYWANYPQFKNFIIWELRVAKDIFMRGRIMKELKSDKQDKWLLNFLESPDAEAMRIFCREELDGVWLNIDPATIRK